MHTAAPTAVGGVDLERARGRMENPGYEKPAVIARAIGFPPEAWFDGSPGRAVARVKGLYTRARNPGPGGALFW